MFATELENFLDEEKASSKGVKRVVALKLSIVFSLVTSVSVLSLEMECKVVAYPLPPEIVMLYPGVVYIDVHVELDLLLYSSGGSDIS